MNNKNQNIFKVLLGLASIGLAVTAVVKFLLRLSTAKTPKKKRRAPKKKRSSRRKSKKRKY